MLITIFGAGYVGLVTASSLSAKGHLVRIIDPDARKVAAVNAGRAPFKEPGLDAIVRACARSGTLMATQNPLEALDAAELAIICTGTPLTAEGESDLSQVESACTILTTRPADLPVVVRSTLPLGASTQLARLLRRSAWDSIATNPEFLRQGTALADMAKPDRVVVGTRDGQVNNAARQILSLYEELDAPRVITDFATAELIKNVSNAFLAARLSLVNEVADLCEAYGADIGAVAEAVGMDPRIGSSYLAAGIGFGGSCLPKELANLVRLAEQKGLTLRALEAAGRSNDVRPSRIADRLEAEVGPLAGCTVAVLGLAFKARTDDTRNSPAIALCNALSSKGAKVVAHDPWVPQDAGGAGIRRAATPEDAIRGASLAVIATEWPMYAELDWAALAAVANRAVVFDGRRMLDRTQLAKAGWHVMRVGSGTLHADEVS